MGATADWGVDQTGMGIASHVVTEIEWVCKEQLTLR